MKLKFSKSEEKILKIIKYVSNALWMIDRNHTKVNTAFAVKYSPQHENTVLKSNS